MLTATLFSVCLLVGLGYMAASYLVQGAVKEALLKKFTDLDPNRFNVDGLGWDRPADPNDSFNHAKNRRVEVKVFTAEKG